MSKRKNKLEVLTIKIFLDKDLHLSGDVDFNSQVFNEERIKRVLDDLIRNLYGCGAGMTESEVFEDEK